MKPTPLAAAMQRAFDEGRDPFDDEQVLAAIERDPEQLEQAAHWRRSVQLLARQAPRRTANRRAPFAWLTAVAVAAAAAAATVAWFCLANGSPTQTDPTPKLRVHHTNVERRVQHHGSALAVQHLLVEATSPRTADQPHDPRRHSRLVQRTETPLTR